MNRVVADVNHLEHCVLRKRMLQSEIKAQGVRALHLWVQERNGLSEERLEAERRSRRLQDAAAGERVAQGGWPRIQIVVARHGHGTLLAESLLVDERIRRVVTVLSQCGDGDGRDEHAEAAADYRLSVKLTRCPRKSDARAYQVGRVLV